MLHQIFRIGFLLTVFAVIRIAAQDHGAFAYLTPLPGIVAEAVDQNGNLYAVGNAAGSSNLYAGTAAITATPGAFQSPPKKCPTGAGCLPVYVVKLDPSGHIVYTALIGGSDVQRVTGIAVDADGNAIITGYTYAPDFPVTPGALQSAFGGGTYHLSPDGTVYVVPGGDAFVTKLNSAGSALIFSTFFGGSDEDWATSIVLDPSGSIYIAGHTASPNFPVTTGAYDQQRRLGEFPSFENGFIARLKPDGSGFVLSTYFDVPVTALALGPDGAIYATGTAFNGGPAFPVTPGAFQTQLGRNASAYAAELSPDGARLMFATLLGGSLDDTSTSIAVLASGAVLVGGQAYSSDFPVVNAPPILPQQAFLATLSPDGSTLLSSYSPGGDMVQAIFSQADGSIWISGFSVFNSHPLTPDSFEEGNSLFFAEHRDGGTQSILYSTTIREGPAMALDKGGNVYIGGGAALEAGKIDFSLVSTAIVIANVMNAGSYESYAIAPGEMVAIFGERLGPAVGVPYTLDTQGRAPRSLGGVSVSFNGIPAPLIYAGATQINAIVPWELTGTTAQVTVQYNGQVSAPFSATVANAVPGIFQSPTVAAPHQAAVINQDGTANSRGNPAPLGSIVSLYVTGLGPEAPVPADGSVTPDASHLAVNPISVIFFGGVPGQVLWAGGAPSLLAGVSQINVRLPQTLPTDTNQSAVVVLIQSGQSLISNVGPTIAVRY